MSRSEIAFDIFVERERKRSIDDIIAYWAMVTEFPKTHFRRIYFLKNRSLLKGGGQKEVKRKVLGMLRIRVKSSSLLARQISGWILGIQRYFWPNSRI
jgi:hypothetical protein